MEDLRLVNILPYTSHAGVELYLNDTRLEGADYLKVMLNCYHFNVIKIIPYNDEKLEIHIVERGGAHDTLNQRIEGYNSEKKYGNFGEKDASRFTQEAAERRAQVAEEEN